MEIRNRIGARTVFGMLGIAALAAAFLFDAPAGLSGSAWQVAGIAALMTCWWVGEVVPLPVTAILPLLLLPVAGEATLGDVAPSYAHPLIFLFFGGFLIGAAFQRWQLHRRVALVLVHRVGTRQDRQVGGFMLAAAMLSMWVSNTATTIMMVPIGLSLITAEGEEDGAFAKSLLLGIAYGASIGGIATLIGTPPNALLAAYLETSYGFELGFGRWMAVGLPVSAILLVLAWLWLTRIHFRLRRLPNAEIRHVLEAQLQALGRISGPEGRVLVIFLLTAALWVFRPILEDIVPGLALSDPGIALFAAVVLFLLPSGAPDGGRLLAWQDAKSLPWGILILFGGGLALARAIDDSGLAVWIGERIAALTGGEVIVLMVAVVTIIILLTELMSNTAATAAFLPVLGGVAASVGENPLILLVPAALAASCAFMMPVATPPNAVVFGSERLRIADMVCAGAALNVIALIVIAGIGYLAVGIVFGVESGVVPDWAMAN